MPRVLAASLDQAPRLAGRLAADVCGFTACVALFLTISSVAIQLSGAVPDQVHGRDSSLPIGHQLGATGALWSAIALTAVIGGLAAWAFWRARAWIAGIAAGAAFSGTTLRALRDVLATLVLAKVAPYVIVQVINLLAGEGFAFRWNSLNLQLDIVIVVVLTIVASMLGRLADIAEDHAAIV